MTRTIHYRPAALRSIRRMDTSVQRRLLAAIERFAASGQGDVRALQGEFQGLLRLRVGKWRVFMIPSPDSVRVVKVDNRGEAY